jgi:hypothetical protein
MPEDQAITASPSIRNDVALRRSAVSTMAGKRLAQSWPPRVKQSAERRPKGSGRKEINNLVSRLRGIPLAHDFLFANSLTDRVLKLWPMLADSSWPGAIRGSVMQMEVPFPGAELSAIRPPSCSVTRLWTM